MIETVIETVGIIGVIACYVTIITAIIKEFTCRMDNKKRKDSVSRYKRDCERRAQQGVYGRKPAPRNYKRYYSHVDDGYLF